MPSDQGKKAGNEGDVVKHPALLASLAVTLRAAEPGSVSRYADLTDLFAGYVVYTLTARGCWRRGVGRLASEKQLSEWQSEFVTRW